jgi:hypothetical protein
VRRIVAQGSALKPASSYYQLAPSGAGKTDKPNINYVTGSLITVEFKERQVESVTVRGKASGFYAEAVPDSSRAGSATDSTAKKPPPATKPPATKPLAPAATKPLAPAATKPPTPAATKPPAPAATKPPTPAATKPPAPAATERPSPNFPEPARSRS